MQETAHVAPWKKEEVAELKALILENPVIALANVEGIPAAQMQKMRRQLRDHATVRVAKNTLLARALDAAGAEKDQVDQLVERIEGQTALIATDLNPFLLFKRLEAAKTNAPAKGGETAPEDIVVEKGDTPFPPGPIVGDLQRAGIPAAIEGGKVVIKKTQVLVAQGDTIPREAAQMLTRLDIHPLVVGFDLRAAFEDGFLFDRSVLDIDQDAFLADLQRGAAQAFNLAVNTAWFTPATTRPILALANQRAMNLGVNAEIAEPGIVEILLARGNGQMLGLASQLDAAALDDELRERVAGAASAAAAPSAPETPAEGADEEDEEEEEEEVSEEDAAAGLGALFG